MLASGPTLRPRPTATPRHGLHSLRAWTLLAKDIIRRDNGICGICGMPGADTAGHIVPVDQHPELLLEPSNIRAEHGEPRPEYKCPGNYHYGAKYRNEKYRLNSGDRRRQTRPGDPPASRSWFA